MKRVRTVLQNQAGLANRMVSEMKRASQLHGTIVAAYRELTNETGEIRALESEFQALVSKGAHAEAEISSDVAPAAASKKDSDQLPEST